MVTNMSQNRRICKPKTRRFSPIQPIWCAFNRFQILPPPCILTLWLPYANASCWASHANLAIYVLLGNPDLLGECRANGEKTLFKMIKVNCKHHREPSVHVLCMDVYYVCICVNGCFGPHPTKFRYAFCTCRFGRVSMRTFFSLSLSLSLSLFLLHPSSALPPNASISANVMHSVQTVYQTHTSYRVRSL